MFPPYTWEHGNMKPVPDPKYGTYKAMILVPMFRIALLFPEVPGTPRDRASARAGREEREGGANLKRGFTFQVWSLRVQTLFRGGRHVQISTVLAGIIARQSECDFRGFSQPPICVMASMLRLDLSKVGPARNSYRPLAGVAGSDRGDLAGGGR